jgi:hypothetical protein
MTKKWLVSFLGAAALAFSAGAMAQAYVGAEVGQTDIDGADEDIGLKFVGGFKFHPNVAAELGFGMMYDKGGAEVNTLEAVAVGMFPVANQISVIGKLGFANVDTDPGERKTEITWGIGAQYDFSRNIGLRALWQRYETDAEIDYLAVGVIWTFQ